MSEDRRKLTIPEVRKSTHAASPAIIQPGIDQLLDDAMSIIQSEIIAYKAKVNKGMKLDLQESRVVQGYVKALCDVKREQARSADERDLQDMTDEEILALVEKIKNKKKLLSGGRNE